MSKHSGGYNVGGAEMQRPKSRWKITPKWHWRYWFGYRMRIRADERYDPPWEYRTFKQHARAVLEETCSDSIDPTRIRPAGRQARY